MGIIDQGVLTRVLSKKFNTDIVSADYSDERLDGGTLGDVRLVTGTATDINGKSIPYKVVFKTQRQWERYGDPGSWRREYDFYSSGFGSLFTDTLRWPECYHAELNNDEHSMWMEYIEGVTGLNMTREMYERAALELGRFQGRLYAEQPVVLKSLTNLSALGYMKSFYQHYRSWNVVYDYIRADDCAIPKHLCDMLIETDANADSIFSRIEKLPVVLCHRDFWVTNIFCADDKIVLLDWDTAGWGYMGEDIASLIADEANVSYMTELYEKCVPAYYKGFSEYADVSHIKDHCVREMILCYYGYRLVGWYLNAETPEGKELQIETLQKIRDFGF